MNICGGMPEQPPPVEQSTATSTSTTSSFGCLASLSFPSSSSMSFFTSYETVKYVAIPDWRLAVLRWILLVGILSYVVVVELIEHFGYLQSFGVTGVTRFSLQQPTYQNCNPSSPNCSNAFAPLNSLPYCRQYYDDHLDDITKSWNGWYSWDERTSATNATTISTQTNDDSFQMIASTRRRTGRQKDFYQDPISTRQRVDPSYPGPIYSCQIYEAVNAQLLRETSVVVWTRATTYNQTLVCDESIDQTCPQTYQNVDQLAPSPFYIAQIEAFTVMIEHAVTASAICRSHLTTKRHRAAAAAAAAAAASSSSSSLRSFHYSCSAQARDYTGRLLSHNSKLCQTEFVKNNSYATERSWHLTDQAPCYIAPNQTATTKQDFFSLDVLLQAAGVQLDDCLQTMQEQDYDLLQGSVTASTANTRDPDKNCSATLRSSGGTLLLQVVWNDAISWRGLVEPHYIYIPQLISRDSYKESQAFYYQEYRQARILMRSHGIKVVVLIDGTFHQFQMLSFLLTITTALGLLAMARVIVDQLMLYVLPDKERYHQAKYERIGPHYDGQTAARPATTTTSNDGSADNDAETVMTPQILGDDEATPAAEDEGMLTCS